MSSVISPLVSHSLLRTGLLHLTVPANLYLPACALPSPLLLIFTGCPGVVAGVTQVGIAPIALASTIHRCEIRCAKEKP